jgi:hypothetical protein
MAKMLTQIDGTQNGAALIDALTTVLRNVTKEETVQYVLALLDDVVSSEPLPFRASFAPSIWRYLPQVLAAGLPPRYCQRLVIIFASDYRRGKYMRKSTCSIGAISHRARSESRVCLLSSRQRESEVDKVHVKCSQAAAAHGLVYPGEGVQAADGGAGREAQQGDPSGQRRRPQRVVRRGVHIHRSTHRRSGQRERAGATLCPVFPGRET